MIIARLPTTCGRTDVARTAFAVSIIMLLTFLTVGMAPQTAIAQGEIERSSPADGETVERLPDVIDLWFAEAADPSSMRIMVIAPNGARIDYGIVEPDPDDPDGRHVTVAPFTIGNEGLFTVHVLTGSPEEGNESSEHSSFTVNGSNECEISSQDLPTTPRAAFCLPDPPELFPGEGATVAGGIYIDLEVSSNRAGPVDLTVTLTDREGNVLEDARVWVRARHLGMDHGEFPHEAIGDVSGLYTAEFVGMGMGGDWRIAVDVIVAPGQPARTVFFSQTMEGI